MLIAAHAIAVDAVLVTTTHATSSESTCPDDGELMQ